MNLLIHVALLCVWIRYVDSDLICHEELLSLEGMHDRTRGEMLQHC